MTNFIYVLAGLLSLVGLISVGLLLYPRPFRPHPKPSQLGEPAAMRPDLPQPVYRHFRETLGEAPPRIETALVWGRGKACFRGVWAPFRFRAWYRPGDAFYRRMEVTWFQRPILRGTDQYIQGEGLYEFGNKEERGPHIDQAQVLSLWAEAVWAPSIYVHDERIQWEQLESHSARLIFPFAGAPGGTESLIAHFDPTTGRMTHFSGERADDEGGEPEPWRVDLLSWKTYHNLLIPNNIAMATGESGSIWSYWDVDGIAYNVNVSDQLG